MREIDQGLLLESIAAASHDCILSLDPEGVIVWSSPATEQVLGWSPAGLAGRDVEVLFPGEGGAARAAAVERLLAGEQVEPFTQAGVRRDGSAFQAQVMLGPVHGPDGQIAGVVAIVRDVTEQLLEQRELASNLEMSRAHFDQAARPQALSDLDGHLESVNPAWREVFGHDERWFAGRDMLELVHPVDRDNVVARMGRLRAGEIDSISFRGMFRGADGHDLNLVLDASVLREPEGRPYAIAVSVGDPGELDYPLGLAPTGRQLSEVLVRRTWDSAVVLDEELAITHVSGFVARMLLYRTSDLLHHRGWEYIHPSDASVVGGMLERLLVGSRLPERGVVRLRDGEQQWRSIEVTATNCLDDPAIGGIVANLRDVTEQVRTEEALRHSEELHRAMVETAREGIVATSAEGLVIYVNETAAEILGRPADQIYGEDPHRLFGLPADDLTSDVRLHEVPHVLPDGRERILQVWRRPLTRRDGGFGALVSVSDVTEARQTEQALRRRALHDPLTLLPNRYLFLDRLETAAARQFRFEGKGTAVLFLDLDDFKQVNDGFGHEAGDRVLREVAARLLTAVRATDTVGRIGGDEFAVICEDVGLDDALVVADRILAILEDPVRVGDHDLAASVSIGVAVSPPYEFDEVVRRADEAMYRAKQLGGGRVAVAGQDEAEQSP